MNQNMLTDSCVTTCVFLEQEMLTKHSTDLSQPGTIEISFKVIYSFYLYQKSFLWKIEQIISLNSDFVRQNFSESCFLFEMWYPSYNWSMTSLQRMPENEISGMRHNCLILDEAEQIHWFIYDFLCILNVERLTELSFSADASNYNWNHI